MSSMFCLRFLSGSLGTELISAAAHGTTSSTSALQDRPGPTAVALPVEWRSLSGGRCHGGCVAKDSRASARRNSWSFSSSSRDLFQFRSSQHVLRKRLVHPSRSCLTLNLVNLCSKTFDRGVKWTPSHQVYQENPRALWSVKLWARVPLPYSAIPRFGFSKFWKRRSASELAKTAFAV